MIFHIKISLILLWELLRASSTHGTGEGNGVWSGVPSLYRLQPGERRGDPRDGPVVRSVSRVFFSWDKMQRSGTHTKGNDALQFWTACNKGGSVNLWAVCNKGGSVNLSAACIFGLGIVLCRWKGEMFC